MSNWLRVLHISDLHERVALDWMSQERQAQVRGGKASRYRVLGPSLVEALQEIRNHHAIDIVCFTGDVADWGLAEEYEQATKRFNSILSAAGVTPERLFLVPGNHDVNQKLAVDAWTEIRKLATARVGDLSRWMAGEGSPFGAQSKWRDDIVDRTAAFWRWVDEDLRLRALSPKNSLHGRLGYCVPITGLGLSFPLYIIGLDSAWLAGDKNDAGKLLLTQRQVDLLSTDKEGKPLPGLRLALVHHPLTNLSDCGESFNLLADRVDVLLHGHQHAELIGEQMNPDRRLYVFATGSLYEGDEEDKYINSFHVLDIQTNDEGRPIRFDFQFWGWSTTGFWYPTGAIYKAAWDGKYTLLTHLGKKISPPDQRVRIAPDRLRAPYRNPAFLDADFKDRAEQRDKTSRLLGDDRKRLICIFGHPGIGKTHLAAKVLWDIEQGREAKAISRIEWDGIVYLSVEDLTFDNLFDMIKDVCSKDAQQDLDALRRSNVDTDQKIGKLMEVLSGGRYIILIDGIESLLDEEGKFNLQQETARDLSQFCKMALETTSESKIVLTSSLRLEIGQMNLRPRIHQEKLKVGLPDEDAIARLRDLDPDGALGLKDASKDQLARIVKITYGIPRALEQVAYILSQEKNWNLTLEDIATKFYQRDDLVGDLVEETCKRLDASSKRVVEALAVFGRPVPQEAICLVLETTPDGQEISDTITRLAKTHLINLERKEKRSCVFSLHPIDQSYIYSRIPEKDGGHNRKEMHFRAADYYASLRRPGEEWKAVKQDLEPQLLEFDQRVKAEDYNGAAQVMDSIDYSWCNHHKFLAYLMFLGYGNEAIRRREELIGKISAKLEVHNRTSLGWVCRRMGRNREAEKHLRMAVAQARAGDDAEAHIYALSELGYFLTDNAGLHDEAEAYLRQASNIAQGSGDAYSQAHIFLGLAFADFQRQRNASSLDNASKALWLFQKVPTHCARYREIDCWVRLGMIHRKVGDYSTAVLTAEKGLEVADKHGLVGWKGELNSGLGFHLRAEGKFEAAVKCHIVALNLFSQQCGMKREEAAQYSYLGNLYADLGLFDDAQKSFEKAGDIAKAIDLRRELSWILANRGVLYCRLGDYERAFALQQQALTIVKENNFLDSQVVRFTDLSATLLAMRKLKEAEEAVANALHCADQDEHLSLPSTLPDAYLKSPHLEDKLPHEMQAPHDHLRRGTILVRIYLSSNDLPKALQVIELAENRQHALNPHKHFSAVLHAIILHRLGRFDEARIAYQKAVEYADDIQLRTPQYYPGQYTRGLALAGLSTLPKDQASDTFVKRAREAYQRAFDMCKAAGVLSEAISMLQEVPSKDDLIALVFPQGRKF